MDEVTDDLTDDERAELADQAAAARAELIEADAIDRMPAHPADTPAPPIPPDAAEEPTGLDEVDPLGLIPMAEELEELDATPDGGPTTYAEIKRRKKRRDANVPLVLDTSVRWALVNARAELKDAETSLLAGPDDVDRRERVDAAMAEVKAVEAQLETVTVVWRVQSIKRSRVRSLIAACPPSGEQLARHRAMKSGLGQAVNEPLYDPDRFQPALVVACSVEPTLSIEEAVEMWDDDEWTEGELDAIFNAAWIINQLPN